MGWLPTKTNYEKHHAPNSPDFLTCAHGFPATRKLNGFWGPSWPPKGGWKVTNSKTGPLDTPGYLSSFGLPPPATEHRIESIQQDEGEERHQNESWFCPLLFVLTLVVTLCSFTEIFGITTEAQISVLKSIPGCILGNTGNNTSSDTGKTSWFV